MRALLLLLTVLVWCTPCARAETLTFDEVRDALQSRSPSRRRIGLDALTSKIIADRRSIFVPGLDEPPEKVDPKAAVALLDAAMHDPELPIGWDWVGARVLLERDEFAGYGSIGNGPQHVMPYPEERKRFFPLIAAVLSQKRDRVVGASLMLLMAFDFRSEAVPPAVARSWPHLGSHEQTFFLTERWASVRSAALETILRRELRAPQRSVPWHHTDDVPSLIAKHGLAFAPKKARALILEDMQRVAPMFTGDALLALPDATLPELEPVWTKHLGDRAFANFEKIALLVERYATPAMLPTILKLYRSSTGWACSLQRAFLGYLLKHDQALGIAEVEKALGRRGKGHTGCYRSVLRDVLPRVWSPAAEALALRHLEDEDIEVVRSAAHALIRAGSREAFEPLLARILRIDWQKKPLHHVRSDLLTRMCVDQERWLADPAIRDKLRAVLEPSEVDALGVDRP